jgi:hypothetical protein
VTDRRAVGVGAATYLVWAITFTVVAIAGDGAIYYDFVRALIGESPAHAYAYQFGVGYWNLPFYALGRLVDAALPGSGFGGTDAGILAIAVASHVGVLLTMFLGWRLLGELDLPPRMTTILLAVFGTPLFYYATFLPSYTHTADALFTTLAAVLLLLAVRHGSRAHLAALGACLAMLVAIRYANAALIPGFALCLALRRTWRDLALVAISFAGSALLLFAVPLLRGIEYASAATMRIVYGSIANDPPPGVDFDPVAPLKMLFTLHRGMFLWTPLTALSVVGLVLLAKSRPELRAYLLGLGVAAAGLIASYSLWSIYWDGGYSFSQRFFTGLFPLFLIGIAELIRRYRAISVLVVGSTLFAMFLGFNHFYGYEGASGRHGVDEILGIYGDGDRTPSGFARLVGGRAVNRWTRDTDP